MDVNRQRIDEHLDQIERQIAEEQAEIVAYFDDFLARIERSKNRVNDLIIEHSEMMQRMEAHNGNE